MVEVEAQDLRDALLIATRVVEGGSARAFGEILVYVREEGSASSVRRVRWTRGGGFETLDFAS